MFKKILFPIIAVFLAYKAYEIIHLIYQLSPNKISFPVTLLLSSVLNLFITGIFAFAGFAYKTNKLLPKKYYSISNPILINKTYKYLGVEWFKKGILFLFWGKENNKKKFFDGSKSGLEHFDFQTRQSEFGHLLAFITIQFVVIIIFIKGHLMIAIYSSVINIIFNFYPIVLQRKHRISIQKFKSILDKRTT